MNTADLKALLFVAFTAAAVFLLYHLGKELWKPSGTDVPSPAPFVKPMPPAPKPPRKPL